MADLTNTYSPFTETFNFSLLQNQLKGTGFEFILEGEAGTKLHADIDQFMVDQAATIADVTVAYTGSTTAERLSWIESRLKAISKRTDLIRQREEILKGIYAEETGNTGNDAFSTFSSIASVIPVVGAVFGWVGSLSKKTSVISSAKRASEAVTKVLGYTDDVRQLAAMRIQLQAEYVSTNPTTSDPTNFAATVQNYGWYIAGFGLLLLLLVWLKRRNRKRKR